MRRGWRRGCADSRRTANSRAPGARRSRRAAARGPRCRRREARCPVWRGRWFQNARRASRKAGCRRRTEARSCPRPAPPGRSAAAPRRRRESVAGTVDPDSTAKRNAEKIHIGEQLLLQAWGDMCGPGNQHRRLRPFQRFNKSGRREKRRAGRPWRRRRSRAPARKDHRGGCRARGKESDRRAASRTPPRTGAHCSEND